jgi:phospholipid/cholesterol/gamma-HCH transport system substrate-binding protein
MSNRVRLHPVAIGVFAAGAVALAIAAVFIFGANKLFVRKFPIVMFFDEDVNGLIVGAPVSYRGLRLGQVTEIHSPVGTPRIAVVATLERGPLLTRQSAAGVSADEMRRTLQEAIGQGLRAQLALQSFLTGQLYVSLVLRPDTSASLAGLGGAALEIPTIPTIMAQLLAGLGKVPLAQVPKYLSDTLEGSSRLLQDPQLAKTLEAVGPVLADAQTLLRRLDREVGPLLASLKQTSDTARTSLEEATRQLDRVVSGLQPEASRLMTSLTETSDTARGAVRDVSGDVQKTLARLGPELAALAKKLEGVSDAARSTLEGAQATLQGVDGALSGEVPLGYQMKQTLQELAAAARSLRALADALERNPESLLVGKPGAQPKR